MVKGIARRVVVIKSPDPKIFDEAIFLVRDESSRGPGVTSDELLREAQGVAEDFVRSKARRRRVLPLPAWAWSLAGGAAVGAAWLASALFF